MIESMVANIVGVFLNAERKQPACGKNENRLLMS